MTSEQTRHGGPDERALEGGDVRPQEPGEVRLEVARRGDLPRSEVTKRGLLDELGLDEHLGDLDGGRQLDLLEDLDGLLGLGDLGNDLSGVLGNSLVDRLFGRDDLLGGRDPIRPAVWDLDDVMCFYRQNILVFRRSAVSEPVLDLVHPELLTLRLTKLEARLRDPGLRALPSMVSGAVRPSLAK